MCLVLAYEGVWAMTYPNYTVPNAFGSVQAGFVAKTAPRDLTRCCGSQKWAFGAILAVPRKQNAYVSPSRGRKTLKAHQF